MLVCLARAKKKTSGEKATGPSFVVLENPALIKPQQCEFPSSAHLTSMSVRCVRDAEILAIPFFQSSVRAGFPSPADDYIEKTLDFNELMVQRPAATFCMRVAGDSMVNAGIFEGDILVVDRSISPKNNQIVIAVLDGELTVKRFLTGPGGLSLMAENEAYPPICVKTLQSFEVWSVVTFIIHKI